MKKVRNKNGSNLVENDKDAKTAITDWFSKVQEKEQTDLAG